MIEKLIKQNPVKPAALGAMMMILFFAFPKPVPADDQGFQLILNLCGKCHGVTLENRCLTGECAAGKTHEIQPMAWDQVIPWMRAMGCRMTDIEQETIIEYLMRHFGKTYPIRWERGGSAIGGWNVVSFGLFHNRLYSGIEGNGQVLRLENDISALPPVWKPVLNTSGYTVYGLIDFKNRLYAGTNDPLAEIWSSSDGEHWNFISRLPEEKGITSLGRFKNFIYAGTTRATIYRSDNGSHWAQVGELIPHAEKQFGHWIRFLIPFKGKLFAGIEKYGIFQSSDGTHWKPFWPNQGFPPERSKLSGFRGVTLFKDALYIGTTSTGEIWKIDSSEEPPTLVYKVDLKKMKGYIGSMEAFDGFLYAGIGGYIYRTNNGREWEEVGHLGPYTIEAMIAFGSELYAGTALPPDAWIFRSNGKSFNPKK